VKYCENISLSSINKSSKWCFFLIIIILIMTDGKEIIFLK
jgi:hypothetical protein